MLAICLHPFFYCSFCVAVWGSYWFLARNKTMHVGVAYRIRRYFANGKKDGEKKWWIRMQRWVDSGEEEMEEDDLMI